MARFLFTAWHFTGHIFPNLAIANELRARGHETAFYTGESARPGIEAGGHRLFPLRHVSEAKIDELVLSGSGILSAAGKPRLLKEKYRQWLLDTVPDQVADLRAILAEWQPDVLVCDPTLWAPFLILHETERIPVAVFSLIPGSLLSGRDAPIAGFPLPRPRNPFARLRYRIAQAAARFFLRDVRAGADGMRARFGLPPLDCPVTDQAGRMPLYLIPGAPELDYQRKDLPPSAHYVGPCLIQSTKGEQLPEWLEQLPAGQPVIYASEGTVHLTPRMLRAVAQGLADQPVQVIMTTGKHRKPEEIDFGLPWPLPSNLHAHQWLTLNVLIPKLSGMVTIGGPSTLMAALEQGIPVVIVPFAWDHPETGYRVAESGCGIHLTPAECTPENMRQAVYEILHNPKYRENAQRIARAFARLGGAPRAAELIEGLVGTSR